MASASRSRRRRRASRRSASTRWTWLGGEPVNLLGDVDVRARFVRVAAERRDLVLGLHRRTLGTPARQSGYEAGSRADRRAPSSQRLRLRRRKRTVAYVSTSVDSPTELYIANADGTGERKLTSFNDKLNQQIAWSPAERFTYPSVGGLEIEGWLMKPARLRGRQEVSARALHPRRSALGSTTRAGSTSSRTSPARASSCSTRTRAARADTAPTSRTRRAAAGSPRTTRT